MRSRVATVVMTVIASAGCGRIDFAAINAGSGSSMSSDASAPATADAAPCAPIACSGAARFIDCNGKCYTTCEDILDRATAVAACAAWGGTLASVRDATEENCLESIVPIQENAWIGLVQAAGAARPADDWTWLDGTPLGYTHWFSGEPNDSDGSENGSEQCGMIYSPSIGSGWNDAECPKSLQIACSR